MQTQTVRFFPTKAAALAVIGSLSDTSKMPGKSWGISADDCKTGRKLAAIPGTVCADCYALKGNYVRYPAIKAAHATRLTAWKADRLSWCKAMVDSIRGQSYFRIFDSGDLQSADMFEDWMAIAAALPDTKFWMATREVGFVRDGLKGRELPPNVTVRMSASFPDDYRIPGFTLTYNGAMVHKHHNPRLNAYVCPAPKQGGQCGDCRACWNREVSVVSYQAH